jgi:hypothetical protein
MAVDTAAPAEAPAEPLTLKLTDDLAASPARGVERAVDTASVREAADLLLVAPSSIGDRDTDVWLLRANGHALSALVVDRACEQIVVTAVASSYSEQLLRAVLGHYALEGVTHATLTDRGAMRELHARLS